MMGSAQEQRERRIHRACMLLLIMCAVLSVHACSIESEAACWKQRSCLAIVMTSRHALFIVKSFLTVTCSSGY